VVKSRVRSSSTYSEYMIRYSEYTEYRITHSE